MSDKEELIQNLKADLHTFHENWKLLVDQERTVHDPQFLKKIAKLIQQLDLHAKEAASVTDLKELAQLLHFALSTPWGAPFVGKTTLIDAANSYKEDNSNSSLQHLLTDFSHYGHKKQAPLQKVFDEILEELNP